MKGTDLNTSIATKQPTKRTHKGLIGRGAQGKHARHDSHPGSRIVDYYYGGNEKPDLDSNTAIAESLECGLFTPNMAKTRHTGKPRPAYTVESSGFACPSAKRQRISTKTFRHHRQIVEAMQPKFDEDGRPIVYVSDNCDAMQLCHRRGR